MNSKQENNQIDRKVLLSTIWVFVLMNMIYADIVGMLRPGYLELLESISKQLNGEVVLVFAILLEIPIAMILLSRLLKYKANRIANLIAVPPTILFVVFGGLDNPPYSYLFFGSVEVVAMVFIFFLAWKWRE